MTKNIDKELILLQVLSEEFENSSVKEIRRARLKDLYEDKLYSDVIGDDLLEYGSSFERLLNVLENKGALKRIKKEKKLTVVIPDKQRIKNLLFDKKRNELLGNTNLRLIEEEVDPTLWEKIVGEGVNAILDDKLIDLIEEPNLPAEINPNLILTFHPTMKAVTSKVISFLASRKYEFYIANNQDEDKIELDKDILEKIGLIATKIASKNLKAAFKLVIEYKGIKEEGIQLGQIFGPGGFKIIAEDFVKWADKYYRYKVSEQDRKNLSTGHVHILSSPTKWLYDKFYTYFTTYVNLWIQGSNKGNPNQPKDIAGCPNDK